jgi:hypothetical protein
MLWYLLLRQGAVAVEVVVMLVVQQVACLL